MRTAKIADYWRRVYSEPYPVRLERTKFQDVLGIGSGEVLFGGGVTAICGGNGVGKSTLLNAIWGSIADPPSQSWGQLRFAQATLSATIGRIASDAVEVETRFSPLGRTIAPVDAPIARITRLDPARRSQELIRFLLTIPSIPELLEPYTAKELTGDELETLGYLIGKDYTTCRITEVADYEDLGTFPYVEVASKGITYGSEMMGLGELALHLMAWELGRLEGRSILLIEEPETHISPRSQQALLDVLARDSTRKKVSVVLTTHSAGIVTRIPREHVRLVYRDGADIRFVSKPTENELNSVIGVTNACRAICLVEDYAARVFAEVWIARVAPDIAHQLDVRDCGDVSKIDAVISAFPQKPTFPRVVGLYDGDQRGVSRKGPHAYLPGTAAPESVLKNAVGDGQRLAQVLGKDPQAVQFALQHVTGLDHHDWPLELGRLLATPFERLVAALVEVWLATDDGPTESATALSGLRTAIG